MTRLEVGDILEQRYRIDRPIARGGMSTVYRCVDLRLGRAVAAKVMHERYVDDPVFLTRFQREARAMAQLNHPNLVGIHDFSADGEPIFLIMDLITGGTLRELVAERGPMPAHAATAAMRAMLQGLAVVHERNMIHRDIKPDNILIDADHQVKLGDFGLVRASSSHTATSDSIVGTVSYLSPEQVTGEEITPASDVYSAGIVLFELLTDSVPFSGDTPLSHALARLDNDVPTTSSRIEGVPQLFDELVATATAREPEDRFSDAAEFLTALDDVAQELQLPAFTVPLPQNAAAARTAAQPTNMSGVGATEIFQPTGIIDNPAAADQSPATEIMSTNPPRREPLSFETRFDPAVSAQPSPATAAMPPAPGFPAPNAAPVPAPNPQPAPQAATTEPEARTLSNRSPWKLALWLAVVTSLTIAIAVGGWWFGSGNYGIIPPLFV